jgi:hypothetical protein
MIKVLFLLFCFTSFSCASKTQHGECVGINDVKDPNKIYKYSARNIILGIIFIQTIFVPVLVVLNQLQCPAGDK